MIPPHNIVASFNISFDLFQVVRKRFRHNHFRVITVLRALIATRIYRTTERGIARRLTWDKALAKACGFRKRTPSQAWISRFRKRIGDLLELIFYELVCLLKNLNIITGQDQSMDATHLHAYSRTKKKHISDTDASWGYKNKVKQWFFGYKTHINCDTKSELPIAFAVSTGKVHDSKLALTLIHNTVHKAKLLANINRADAAYNATYIREEIRHYQSIDDIPHKGEARKKKKTNPRASIEHINSRQKDAYGLDNLKLRGLTNIKAHAALCLIAQLLTAYTVTKLGHPELIRKTALW